MGPSILTRKKTLPPTFPPPHPLPPHPLLPPPPRPRLRYPERSQRAPSRVRDALPPTMALPARPRDTENPARVSVIIDQKNYLSPISPRSRFQVRAANAASINDVLAWLTAGICPHFPGLCSIIYWLRRRPFFGAAADCCCPREEKSLEEVFRAFSL